MGIVLFLYSQKNLVGVSLALVGVLLYLLGFHSLWYVIIPGLYVIGLLITPTPIYTQHAKPASDAEIVAYLKDTVQQYQRRLPKEALDKVHTIEALIVDALPRVAQDRGGKEAYTIRQMALDYLPVTLQNYVNLPTAFANMHPIKDGKTAKVILIEQLAVLEKGMQDLSASVLAGDAQKMLANGHFLEESFAQAESFL